MIRPSSGAAALFLLAACGFLATPVLAVDPVFIINTTDRPWRLLSASGPTVPLEVTTQGDGAQPVRRVYPAFDFRTWMDLRGDSFGQTGDLKKAYRDFFQLDAIVPPGKTIQLEHAGTGYLPEVAFFLCDANERAIDMGASMTGKIPTVFYEVRSPFLPGTGGNVARLRPHSIELTRPVLQYSESNPTVLTILRPDWGTSLTFRCQTPTLPEGIQLWEPAAKASGADPLGNEIAWQKARKATPASTAPGEEEKGPALERKE